MNDRAHPIRPGENIDIDVLQRFFDKKNIGVIDKILQFPSGFSNLTYLVQTERKDYVLRRPPFGANAKGGHNMEREHNFLETLYPIFPLVPRTVALETSGSVLGAPFFVMERVEGFILRNETPPALMRSDFFAKLSTESAIQLAQLHDLPTNIFGRFGNPEGYVARQIYGWEKRYQKAKNTDIPGMDILFNFLKDRMPAESGISIIHNDYKYDNMVLDPENFTIKAILDWEMATIGCPLMDLGACLGYWIEADDPPELLSLPFCPTHHLGNLTRLEFIQTYASERNIEIDNASFYLVYGVWRIAIILQQIYARYRLGHTKDSRFAALGDCIPLLAQHALRLAQQ